MKSRASMSPTKALMIFGAMMLVMSALTMWAISTQDTGGSPGLGAVSFSEESQNNAIKVQVIESGSVQYFEVETNTGETVILSADSGASRTIENVNSVTVYGVSDNERTQINSYTGTWAR